MADVGDDRGQLLLVAAVGLAVLFVTLALVVNTVIYTENLATRSSKVAGGSEATSYRSAVEAGIGGFVTYANYHNNTTHADLQSNLSDGVGEWSDAAGTLYAQSGTGTNISIDSIDNGTRIRQDNSSRNFTDAEADADWTLATDVSVRGFWMNVTRSSLTDSTKTTAETDTVFHVDLTDADGQTWEVFIYKNLTGPATINVSVKDPGAVTLDGPCSSTQSHTFVNITAGTVNGSDCSALDIYGDMDRPIDIEYKEATTAGIDAGTGTYELIVNDSSIASSPPSEFHDDSSGESPYVTPAIYSTRIDITYQSPRLYFNTSVRVAPGEDDG